MADPARIVLIVLGALLLVLVFLPLLFMGGMMGMMGAMMGGGQCCGGMSWAMAGLAVIVLLAGVALVVVGLRRS